MAALDALVQTHLHIIAQIVETKLGVCPVGEIGIIGQLAIDQFELVLILMGRFAFQIDQEGFAPVFGAGGHLQHAHFQPQHFVDRRFPASITTGQVIVDRDQVHAAAHGNTIERCEGPFIGIMAPFFLCKRYPFGVERQRIQVKRQGGHQGFAFAGFHLRHDAAMQGDTADHLDIIVAQADSALADFAHGGVGFGQDIIEGFAFGQAGAELVCFGRQLFHGERLRIPAQGC